MPVLNYTTTDEVFMPYALVGEQTVYERWSSTMLLNRRMQP